MPTDPKPARYVDAAGSICTDELEDAAMAAAQVAAMPTVEPPTLHDAFMAGFFAGRYRGKTSDEAYSKWRREHAN